MSSQVLYAVLALILAAEFQLTSSQEGVASQHDNSSIPVAYSATVLEGGGQVCPPEEQLEMARAEIAIDILNTIRIIVRCPGQVPEDPHHPVVKYHSATLNSHQNTTGSKALMEQLFRSIVT